MNVLEAKVDFKAKLEYLKLKTSQNFEEGFYYMNDDFGNISYNPIQGLPGAHLIDYTISETINGFMHTHFDGGYSIFSPGDLAQFYALYTGGAVRDVDTFSMQVITSQGTVYSLAIEDEAKFDVFGSLLLFSEPNARVFYGSFGLAETNSNMDNEANFLNFLNFQGGSGLKLFKGDINNLNSWTPIGLNGSGEVVNSNCN